MAETHSNYVKLHRTPAGEFAVVISERSNQIITSGFTDNLDHLAQITATDPLNTKRGANQIDLMVEQFLHNYFEKKSHPNDNISRLQIKGTQFQLDIWKTLSEVPFGAKITYKELAENSGYKNAYRAAGTACAMNNHALFIPCHRVILSNGQTGSYRWGIKTKHFLLNHEKV